MPEATPVNRSQTLVAAPHGRVSTPGASNEYISWTYIKSLIPTIRALSDLHGDFATVKSNIIRLCNTGHTFSLVCPTEQDLIRAQESLNNFTDNVRPKLGGMHGVINQMLSQLSTDGAASVEAEVEFSQNIYGDTVPISVAAIHEVDTRTLVLVYSDKEFGYIPFQAQGGTTPVRLPDATYQLQVFKPLLEPHPPYPVPPMIAGVAEARRQKEAIASIDRALRKSGILGIMDATVEQPERYDSESDTEYEARMEAILSQVVEYVGKSMSKGVYAHYGALDFKFTNFGAEFAQAVPFLEYGQARMARSLQNDWASENTARASSFLSIIYEKTLNEMVHYQHLVTNPAERFAFMHLTFDGMANGFTVYNATMSLDQDSVRYWENEQIRVDVAKSLTDLGVSSDDALRYVGANVKTSAAAPAQTKEIEERLKFTRLKAYAGRHDELYQGFITFDPKNQSDTKYTLATVDKIRLADL